MGFLGFGKKNDDVVDLGERYRRQQEKIASMKEVEESPKEPINFFTGLVNAAKKQNEEANAEMQEYPDLGDSIEMRRQKLTKRLMEMTNKMEDLSNQIYHLQQRIELLERKLNVNLG